MTDSYIQRFSPVQTNFILHTLIRIHWLYRKSRNSVVKTLGIDVITTSYTTSTFNMVDVNVKERGSFIATPTYARKSIHHSSSVRIEISVPRGHCLISNSDPRTDFSIRTSHTCNILIIHNG